jgi:hypothetical protein
MAKINIEVEAAVNDAVTGLKQVDGALGNMQGTTRQTGLSLTDIKSGLDLASQGFSAVKGAVESVINPVLEYNKSIRDLRDFTGNTAEESSLLVNVFDDMQISYQVLRTAARKFADEGQQLNIDKLAEMADKYNAIQDPVRRTTFLTETFGARAGPEMARLLAQGSTAIRGMADEAENLGLVMDDAALQSARNYEIAMDDLEDSTLALKIQLAEFAIPAVTGFMDAWASKMGLMRAANEALETGAINAAEYAAILARQLTPAGLDASDELASLNEKLDAQAAALVDASDNTQDYAFRIAKVIPLHVDYNTALSGTAQGYAEMGASANATTVDMRALTLAMENSAEIAGALSAGLSGELSGAQDDYRRIVEETSAEIATLNVDLAKYRDLQGETITVVNEASVSSAEYELAALKAAAAQAKFAEYTGDSREEQLQLQVAMETANERVIKLGEGLGQSATITLDYTTKIQDTTASISALSIAQQEAEAQLALTTAQFLFQQVASTLTKEAQLELANALGLIDDTSYDAAIAMQELTAKYDTNRDGTISAAEATRQYKADVVALRDEIAALKDKTVRITTVFHNEGSPGMPGTGGGGTGDYDQNNATAGANN